MKLNIEVDLSRADGGISFSVSNVWLENYHKIKKSDIDEAVCKALEIALIGEGKTSEQAALLAKAICCETSQSQSACQEDTTSQSDLESSDI